MFFVSVSELTYPQLHAPCISNKRDRVPVGEWSLSFSGRHNNTMGNPRDDYIFARSIGGSEGKGVEKGCAVRRGSARWAQFALRARRIMSCQRGDVRRH